MPELPEIANLARQMQSALPGKVIRQAEIRQAQCLNLPEAEFSAAVRGAQWGATHHRGKWIIAETDRGWLLLCLGMGGEILLVNRATMPPKYRVAFDFEDGNTLAINFWWFGYVHYAPPDGLAQHTMTAKLGHDALDLTAADLQALLAGRRGQLKAFLLDQGRIAGIGNFYIHDILFQTSLHPLRTIASLRAEEIAALATAIHKGLQISLDLGGAAYERDLYNAPGGYTPERLQVAYREGQPCPVCGTLIEKIKTGGTSSFICPICQPLE